MGILLEGDEDRGEDVNGTNDVPPRFDMWVKSSAPPWESEAAPYIRVKVDGSDSWSGRSKNDNRNEELVLVSGEGRLRVRSMPWGARA